MDINYKQNGVRFSLPAHDTLVSWMNQKNNRSFGIDEFTFSDPVVIAPDGWVRVEGIYVPLDQPVSLELQRVDLSLIPELSVLTIYVRSNEPENVLAAIHEQYGLYLNLNEVTLSFDELDDTSGTIVISDSHLVWTGTLSFKIKPSIRLGDLSIDTKMNLREFYMTSDDEKPWIETLQPGGLWLVTRDKWHDHAEKRLVDSKLYNLDRNERPIDHDLLSDILTNLTGHPWVVNDSVTGYNVMGIEILYNGTSGNYPNVAPVGYSYLLILKLGDLCSNLKGNIHIGYQYANTLHPVYSTKSPAGVPPIG